MFNTVLQGYGTLIYVLLPKSVHKILIFQINKKMPTIRRSNPGYIIPIWQSVRLAVALRQQPDILNIVRNFQSQFLIPMNVDIEKLLVDMVSDGLLTIGPGRKPDTQVYAIPKDVDQMEALLDIKNQDAYCFECHSAGDVINCLGCKRVFHEHCVRSNFDKPLYNLKKPVPPVMQNTYDEFYEQLRKDSVLEDRNQTFNSIRNDSVMDESLNTTLNQSIDNLNKNKYCTACKIMDRKIEIDLAPKELNFLLSFVFARVKSWLPSESFSNLEPTSIVLTKNDVETFNKIFFRIPMTTSDINKNIKLKKYKNINEFQCDLLNVQHCIGIIRGVDFQEYEATKYLVLDALRELSELKICPDCYRHSNVKGDKWFTRPCSIQHKLVFAKQAGWSYWPAKVLRVINGKYDVRFFGAKHTRARIDEHFIKPYTVNLKSLNIKKTQGFKHAMDELTEHEKHLKSKDTTPTILDRVDEVISDVIKGETVMKTVVKSAKLISPYGSAKRKRNSNTSGMSSESGTESVSDATLNKKRAKKVPAVKKPSQVEAIETVTVKGDNVEVVKDTEGKPVEEEKIDEEIVDIGEHAAIDKPEDKPIENAEDEIIEVITIKDDGPDDLVGPKNVLKMPKMVKQNFSKQNQEPQISSTQNAAKSPSTLPRIKGNIDITEFMVNRMRRKLDTCTTIEEAKEIACETLKEEINRWNTKIKTIKNEHFKQILNIKQKEWCANCHEEAIYHCCFSTAYCTKECQAIHWESGHKEACQRHIFADEP